MNINSEATLKVPRTVHRVLKKVAAVYGMTQYALIAKLLVKEVEEISKKMTASQNNQQR